MSAIRKIPTINSVTPQIKLQHDFLQIPALKMLSAAAQTVYQQTTKSLTVDQTNLVLDTQNIRPTALRLQKQALDLSQKSNLSITEAAQVAGLVAANIYITANPQTIEQNWTPLKSATSLESAKVALGNFIEQLEVNHHQVIVDNLVVACHNAALKIEFKPLESSTNVVNGTVRLIASDDTGRSLVTEIATNSDSPVQMATEIIGSSDGTCEQTLDAFEAALKEEGVTYASPERKFTGGICELEAAKEFVRKRPTKKTEQQSENQTTNPKKKAIRSLSSQKQIRQGFK